MLACCILASRWLQVRLQGCCFKRRPRTRRELLSRDIKSCFRFGSSISFELFGLRLVSTDLVLVSAPASSRQVKRSDGPHHHRISCPIEPRRTPVQGVLVTMRVQFVGPPQRPVCRWPHRRPGRSGQWPYVTTKKKETAAATPVGATAAAAATVADVLRRCITPVAAAELAPKSRPRVGRQKPIIAKNNNNKGALVLCLTS